MTAIPTVPGALPLLGHALALGRDPARFLTSLAHHGDVVRVKLGPRSAYVVCHPDLVRQVLRDDHLFDKGGPAIDATRDVLGNGLVTCPHADHRRQRSLLQPAFSHARLAGYAQVMTEQIGLIMDSWTEGQIIDVPAQMRTITGAIMSATLVTGDGAVSATTAVAESMDDIVGEVFRRAVLPSQLMRRWPGRFARTRANFRDAVARCLADYRHAGVDCANLLSVLAAMRDDQGQPLPDTEIEDQVLTLLAGGVETAANTLSWALHLIAGNHDIRKRLEAETDTVLDGRIATSEDLPSLELTRRVITETLRLYPPAWLLTRTVVADTDLGGYFLPAGAILVYSPYIIHRRSDCYHDAYRFDPDRWLPERSMGRRRNAYLPFATGPRKCIGDTFAMTETILALASITARWEVLHATATPIRPARRITLAPHDLHMRLHLRTSKRVSEFLSAGQ